MIELEKFRKFLEKEIRKFDKNTQADKRIKYIVIRFQILKLTKQNNTSDDLYTKYAKPLIEYFNLTAGEGKFFTPEEEEKSFTCLTITEINEFSKYPAFNTLKSIKNKIEFNNYLSELQKNSNPPSATSTVTTHQPDSKRSAENNESAELKDLTESLKKSMGIHDPVSDAKLISSAPVSSPPVSNPRETKRLGLLPMSSGKMSVIMTQTSQEWKKFLVKRAFNRKVEHAPRWRDFFQQQAHREEFECAQFPKPSTETCTQSTNRWKNIRREDLIKTWKTERLNDLETRMRSNQSSPSITPLPIPKK